MVTSDHSQSIITWATAVSAIASIVNGICVIVLARITSAYAKSTSAILEESQKTRVAGQKQALAAEQQASAAHRSVELMQEQLMEQAGLGHSIVQSAIESAASSIIYWKNLDLEKMAAFRAVPPADSLVPGNALPAVDHARRISVRGSQYLSEAFDDLRNAVSEVESMRQADLESVQGTDYFKGCSLLAKTYLEHSFVKIQKAQAVLLFPKK